MLLDTISYWWALFWGLVCGYLLGLITPSAWRAYQGPKYRVVPHNEPGGDAWGKLFAIVDRSGTVHGIDRYGAAIERCAAMNARKLRTVE